MSSPMGSRGDFMGKGHFLPEDMPLRLRGIRQRSRQGEVQGVVNRRSDPACQYLLLLPVQQAGRLEVVASAEQRIGPAGPLQLVRGAVAAVVVVAGMRRQANHVGVDQSRAL